MKYITAVRFNGDDGSEDQEILRGLSDLFQWIENPKTIHQDHQRPPGTHLIPVSGPEGRKGLRLRKLIAHTLNGDQPVRTGTTLEPVDLDDLTELAELVRWACDFLLDDVRAIDDLVPAGCLPDGPLAGLFTAEFVDNYWTPDPASPINGRQIGMMERNWAPHILRFQHLSSLLHQVSKSDLSRPMIDNLQQQASKISKLRMVDDRLDKPII